MKNEQKRRIISVVVCAAMLTASAGQLGITAFAYDTSPEVTSDASAGNSYTVEQKSVDMYFLDPETKDKTDIYFVNGTDIPYMDLESFVELVKAVNAVNPKYNLKFKAEGDIVTLTRETKYQCIIDFSKDTMYFQDYNAFLKVVESATLVDDVTMPEKDENGKRIFLKRVSSGTTERYGSDVTLDLGSYGIDFVRQGDKYYVPLQTLCDTLMGAYSPYLFFFNGNAMFITAADASELIDAEYKLTPLGELFYNGKTKGSISTELAEFNYNELCFALDHSYGLKENHNITTFDELMTNTGLKELMLSGKSEYIDTAMYILSTRYLDDGHTKYGNPGYSTDYTFREKVITEFGEGATRDHLIALMGKLSDARAKYYPDGVPGYEEIGDTAFITFDSFMAFDDDVDYYKTPPTADSTDTIGLISYSVQQILRKNSPIKNVVLDLSNNGGGMVNAAAYTIGAFLGSARLSLEDRNTGALVTTEYRVDTNLDHKFNSKDYLAGKGLNLYCLESSFSFSCGNLVPCMFKQSSDVSLIGETSGGGACSVMWLSTAAGGTLRISSASTSSFLKNGSLYDVDRGADPDYYLSNIDCYYDREKLVEYIHGLM